MRIATPISPASNARAWSEFVDALPRNATGKIHKPTLRKEFAELKPTDLAQA